MCKWQRVIPRHKKKSSLSDCTWLENENGSFNLEALNFLMHFRELGSSLYAYSYIFFLSSLLSFFLSFFFSFIHSFFVIHSVMRLSHRSFDFFNLHPFEIIPSYPGYTGLTGALDRSDRCNPWWVFALVNVCVCSLLSCVGVVSSLGQFGGRFACLVLWGLSGCDRSNQCVSPV
jgi:hypothetical protein